MNMPIYCARGRTAQTEHLAAWLVQGGGRQEVVCDRHLEAGKKSAGPKARVRPVQQPPDVIPPAQPALF